MKTIQNLFFALLAVGFLAIAGTPALADDCGRLGGAINGAGECEISTAVTRSDVTAPGGPYTISETLRIKSTGKITIPSSTAASSLTLNIAGQLIMEDGAVISGDTTPLSGGTSASQQGATITINAFGKITLAGDLGNGGAKITSEMQAGSCVGNGRGGNITLISTAGGVQTDDGSVISSSSTKCPAGDIAINATPTGNIDVDGSVLAQSKSSGSGTGKAGGGKISIIAGCNLTISDTGVVSSQGRDQGADLVHLEACQVVVHGLVESVNVEGGGHADGVDNACNTDLLNHPYPGKANYFTGCVEIWSATTIVIDRTGGNNGEVSVDGVVANSSWIDLFARGNITIISDAVGYAVHGNPTGATNNSAALITIKSGNGNVSTTGKAIQANATGGGSAGGVIIVQAFGDVLFDAASIQATGPNSGTGPKGGLISARAFNGIVSGTAPGELNASGGVGGTGTPGKVTLQGCGTGAPGDGVAYTGTVIPNPFVNPGDVCGGNPFIQATLPPTTCTELCKPPQEEDPKCEKASVKSVMDPLTGRFMNNKGADVIVRLDLNQSVQDALNTATDTNGDGYIIVAVLKDGTGQLGGSTTESIVIDRAYEKRFALIACSVTLKDADTKDGNPTALIATTASSPAGSPENIFVMDLHTSMSENAGWKVAGDNRYLRNVNAKQNSLGVWFSGNGNNMHNGSAVENLGVGLLIEGAGNKVDSTDSYENGSHGIQVTGNGNTIKKTDIGDRNKGNGGDGLKVNGDANVLSENDVYASVGNGILVVGKTNQLLKNNVGDRTKQNGGDGINLFGGGNTVSENDVYSNLGNGIVVLGGVNTLSKNQAGDRGDKANGKVGFLLGGGGSVTENTALGNLEGGFWFTSAGFTLKNNVSGGTSSGSPNGIFQYKFDVAGNVNSGGNKFINTTITGATIAAGIK